MQRFAKCSHGGSPMSGESLEAFAVCRIPQLDRAVTRPTDDSLAVGRPIDRRDRTTAIFLMSGNTYVTVVYASPPLTGGNTQRFAK